MPKAKILVVDDEAALRELLTVNLEMDGFEVVKACDGTDGVQQSLSQKPHMLILDLNMPGMDGFEVCRRLKSDPQTRSIPILVLSAYSQPEIKKRAFDLGATAYMEKPANLVELSNEVHRILNIPA